MKTEKLTHPIAPTFDAHSRILILGSFPSQKSRETGYFYGHPQNRFWKVTAAVFDCPVPQSVEEKKAFLLAHGVALWDVIASCEIAGSSDASIRNVRPNDVPGLLAQTRIDRIFLNGKTAARLYDKYLKKEIALPAVCLPSTSPANASWNFARLIDAWSVCCASRDS